MHKMKNLVIATLGATQGLKLHEKSSNFVAEDQLVDNSYREPLELQKNEPSEKSLLQLES